MSGHIRVYGPNKDHFRLAFFDELKFFKFL